MMTPDVSGGPPAYDPSAPAAAAPGASDAAYNDKESVDFKIPEDFHVPAGIKPGDQFDAVGTFRMKDDTTMCLVELEGSTVKPAPESNENESDNSSFVDRIEQGMTSTGQ